VDFLKTIEPHRVFKARPYEKQESTDECVNLGVDEGDEHYAGDGGRSENLDGEREVEMVRLQYVRTS
jgi:hypothetical protein